MTGVVGLSFQPGSSAGSHGSKPRLAEVQMNDAAVAMIREALVCKANDETACVSKIGCFSE